MPARPAATWLDRLQAASVATGAPSARNLLVTVFGDAVRPHGDETALSVRSLAALLEPFEVTERSVRTSLTRLVNEGLLANRAVGRRSYYSIAPEATSLFAGADRRIYGATVAPWDGTWTMVVIDGAEGTVAGRAELRQRLTWAGLGVVAPNVMASPIVSTDEAASVVEHVGGFGNVLVSRSELHLGGGTISEADLVRRCAPIDDIAARYGAFIEEFEPFGRISSGLVAPSDAFKLRIWLIATFRRIALVDPQLPATLMPDDWAGATARRLAATIYRQCAAGSEQHLAATAEPLEGALRAEPHRLEARFAGQAS